MDFRIAGEVGWQGCPAPVLDPQIGQSVAVEPEFAVVGGENQFAVGRQQSQRPTDEFDVIPLHIEVLIQPLGVGKGRRVEKDQVVALARPDQPLPAIGPDQLVPGTTQGVQFQIAPRPVQIGRGQIDRGGAGRAAQRGVNRRRAGVAEQVEEAPPGRSLSAQPEEALR